MQSLLLRPPWPALPFKVFCPDTPERCALLNSSRTAVEADCFEPESVTMEVYVSLLHHCQHRLGCAVVDVGCNMGLFASFAASMGAHVQCFEPSSRFAHSLNRTASHYGADLFSFRRAAIVATDDSEPFDDDGRGYRPCDVGRPAPLRPSPRIALREVLESRPITLLKIDTDAADGQLLHVATALLESGRASIDSILVELGCFHPRLQKGVCKWAYEEGVADQRHPRRGDVHDLWRLQQLGYDVFRVNTHVSQEVYDWQGNDVSTFHAPRDDAYTPLHFVRAMKTIELLARHNDSRRYGQLVRRSQSFLVTKVKLLEGLTATAQPFDTEVALGMRYQQKGSMMRLNRGNPAV